MKGISTIKQKRVVSRLIEQAKREHYSNIVTDCNGDQKRLFHVINDLLNKKTDEIFPDTIQGGQKNGQPMWTKFDQIY